MNLFSKRNNRILIPFGVMTASIITLSILSQILINSSLNDIRSDANVINIAGRQRTLSQQIIKEIAADNLVGKTIGDPIDNLINTFSKKQNALLTGDDKLNLKQLDKRFVNEYYEMDVAYNAFLEALDKTVGGNNSQDFLELMYKQERYLEKMQFFISAVDRYSNNKINKFQVKEIVIVLGSIGIIFLEVIFIFLPAINKMQKQNGQLKNIAFNQSRVVRRPVSNLKGLLYLIDNSKLDRELKELIGLANSEAEKLDVIVKRNIASPNDA